jgi:hypothetical protein
MDRAIYLFVVIDGWWHAGGKNRRVTETRLTSLSLDKLRAGNTLRS